MSRPASRRAFLAGSTAALASGVAMASAAPDPAILAAEAERVAWEAFGDAGAATDDTEAALIAIGWDRKPRALVGEYTAMTRGPDFTPLPPADWKPAPVYVHDHEAIDRDCDSDARAPSADPVKVEARRARLHRELDEDAAAIAAVPEVVRYAEAERLWDEANDAWKAAAAAMVATIPTTAAGLVAILDRFEVFTDGCMVSEQDGLSTLLATVRTFVTREAQS